MTLDLDHVKKLTPGWWGAIAGAAAAGATLVPSSRVLAGAAGGVAMLLVALHLTPCCDGCAAGQGCGASAPADPPTTEVPLFPTAEDRVRALAMPPGVESPPTRAEDPGELLARAAVAATACRGGICS